MARAFKMELCTDCDCWIDEGEEIFWNKDGDIICENCKEINNPNK